MKGFLSLKQALASSGGHVRVSGWIRSVRKQKNVAFVSLFDGSGARDLQVVLAPNQLPEVATAGASVCVEGSMTTSPGSKQSKELAATRLVVVGPCDDRSFPLQKKEHSEEFLREIGHLRARTSVFAAVMRLRHATGLAMSQYLNGEGFVQVHCPVIVSGDCEGAGEMFRVSDSSSKSPFFGKDAFLTVSAQLHGEAFACGMSRVYSFGPTFRAERHSKTAHHLAEFWMLEPEFAFADLSQLIQLAEGTVRSGLECVLSSHLEDLEVIGLRKKEQLQGFLDKPFAVMSYTQAIEVLKRASTPFNVPVEWGMDLQREHERFLCEAHTFNSPVFVTDYPAKIKPFYAKPSEERPNDCVQAVDLLVPGIGELIGGSVRENDAERLRNTMLNRKMQLETYDWYIQLREFGSGNTAGFGLGFERFLQFGTGVANIRDVSPVPRWAASGVGVRFELLPYDPVANETAQVVLNSVRITVLTDRLFRITIGPPEDRATLAFINRKLPVPSFVNSSIGGTLSVETKLVRVQITGSDLGSLSVTSKANAFAPWTGIGSTGNLFGTIRTLDLLTTPSLNCTVNRGQKVHKEELHCAWGVISRSGVSVIDDSGSWCLSKDLSFWDSPSVATKDVYVFAHGSDFRGALFDYVLVGGRAALPLRGFLGIMHSRWYNYDLRQVKEVVEAYKTRDLPLDVFIFDMDWHIKHWGGYSWDANNFPVPEAVLSYLQGKENLLVGANFHDDTGVGTDETKYNAMKQAIGYTGSNAIPFQSCVNKTVAFALEDVVVSPLGFDVPWIDWQQGGDKGGCTDGTHNPTIWLNRLRATANLRNQRTKRGMGFGRFGGLGNHRYPTGFSGDVLIVDWKDLAYQPYFSMTASNVLFAWSHDILGPHQLPGSSNELQVRWIQWGAFSSMFRTHDRGMAEGTCYDLDLCATVEVFDLPKKYFDPARQAMIERSRLLSYIYSAQRELFDTGVSLLRPMYYDYPNLDDAYLTNAAGDFSQYMFGPNLMVAPIVAKSSEDTGLSSKNIWIPPGCWFEIDFGHVYCTNGSVVNREYGLTEIPRFVPANKILLRSKQSAFDVDVFPNFASPSSSSYSLYEDDGVTTAYLDSSSFRFSQFNLTVSSLGVVTLVVTPSVGVPTAKTFRVRIFNYVLPQNISCSEATSWSYNAALLALEVQVQASVSSFRLTVNPSSSNLFNDLAGISGKIRRAQLAKQLLDHVWQTPGALVPQVSFLGAVATFPDVLESAASSEQFADLITQFPGLWSKALAQVESLKFDPLAWKVWKQAFAQMKSVDGI